MVVVNGLVIYKKNDQAQLQPANHHQLCLQSLSAILTNSNTE